MVTNTIFIIAGIYWCLDKKLGEYILISLAGADLVNGFAKVTACVYRPWIMDSRVQPIKEAIATATGYSFPSGHVTDATVFFGAPIFRGKLPKILNYVLIACIVIVAISRSYLGVHSILDVIFGILFTLIILWIFSKLFDKLEENPNLDIIISCVGIAISILVVIFALTKSYPMDYDAAGRIIVDPAVLVLDTFGNAGLAIAAFISWPLERRFIRFSTDGTAKSKAAIYVIGFVFLLAIETIVMPLFGQSNAESFLEQFVLIIFVMLIYPAIIRFLQNRNAFGN